MRLPCLLAVLLATLLPPGCAHSPPPPPAPRPLGHDVNLARNDATLALRFRYELAQDRALTLLVGVQAGGSGRGAAAGINALPMADLEKFLVAFESAFSAQR